MCIRTELELDLRHMDVGFKGQDTDTFLSVYGVMHVIVNSRKPKEKSSEKRVLEDIFPPGLKDKVRELQEKHGQAIKEEDCQLALLSDDIFESKKQMVKSKRKMTKLKQDTVELQGAVERLGRPHLEDTR